MLQIKRIVIAALWMMVISSCQDIVHITLPETRTVLALDGWITNRPGGDTVYLYQTQNYFNSKPNPRVSGALLSLTSDSGQSETLQEVLPGKYLIAHTRAVLGRTYTLNILYSGDQFRASTKIARTSPRLDSLQFSFKQKGLRVDTTGYYSVIFGQELPGLGDNVRFILYRNHKLANPPSELDILNDQFTDGKYLTQLQLNQRSPFHVGDSIRLEAWSLSTDDYNFYNDLRTQLDNNGIFSKTPVNVRTNLINVNPQGKLATGYFGGSLVTSISSTIY